MLIRNKRRNNLLLNRRNHLKKKMNNMMVESKRKRRLPRKRAKRDLQLPLITKMKTSKTHLRVYSNLMVVKMMMSMIQMLVQEEILKARLAVVDQMRTKKTLCQISTMPIRMNQRLNRCFKMT